MVIYDWLLIFFQKLHHHHLNRKKGVIVQTNKIFGNRWKCVVGIVYILYYTNYNEEF